MAKVLKPFVTDVRRFDVDDEISPNDISGALTYDDWCDRGFIGLANSAQLKPSALPDGPMSKSTEK